MTRIAYPATMVIAGVRPAGATSARCGSLDESSCHRALLEEAIT
jgi:hypothetical protein